MILVINHKAELCTEVAFDRYSLKLVVVFPAKNDYAGDENSFHEAQITKGNEGNFFSTTFAWKGVKTNLKIIFKLTQGLAVTSQLKG